jgi:hypothetical protein
MYPEVLNADQEVEAQRELVKQTDVVRVKNMSVVATEPGNLIRCHIVCSPNPECRLQGEISEMMKEW